MQIKSDEQSLTDAVQGLLLLSEGADHDVVINMTDGSRVVISHHTDVVSIGKDHLVMRVGNVRQLVNLAHIVSIIAS